MESQTESLLPNLAEPYQKLYQESAIKVTNSTDHFACPFQSFYVAETYLARSTLFPTGWKENYFKWIEKSEEIATKILETTERKEDYIKSHPQFNVSTLTIYLEICLADIWMIKAKEDDSMSGYYNFSSSFEKYQKILMQGGLSEEVKNLLKFSLSNYYYEMAMKRSSYAMSLINWWFGSNEGDYILSNSLLFDVFASDCVLRKNQAAFTLLKRYLDEPLGIDNISKITPVITHVKKHFKSNVLVTWYESLYEKRMGNLENAKKILKAIDQKVADHPYIVWELACHSMVSLDWKGSIPLLESVLDGKALPKAQEAQVIVQIANSCQLSGDRKKAILVLKKFKPIGWSNYVSYLENKELSAPLYLDNLEILAVKDFLKESKSCG
jgi:hypothetical protein